MVRFRAKTACVLAAALIACGALRRAQAALDELPRRQRINEAIAVLRGLYAEKLQYMDKLRLVRYNIELTCRQIETLQALILTEVKRPGSSARTLMRYNDTVEELLDQLRDFGPQAYFNEMKNHQKMLEGLKKVLDARRAALAKKGEKEAIKDLDKELGELNARITAAKSAVDGFKTEADKLVDYEKIFNKRLAEIESDLARYESILAARIAAYRALFGHDPGVDTDYKTELDRVHPAEEEPGLLSSD